MEVTLGAHDLRPFSLGDVGGAIKVTNTSTAREPDDLTVVHLRNLGPVGLTYLMSNISLS